MKIKILMIEDELSIRDMVRFAFKDSGFLLIEAGNIMEAEQKILKQIPDLILLDWMLPGMSGIDFIKQLKRKPQTKEIPIIMLTAKAGDDNKIKGLETGADDYVTKPFSPRELMARIKTVLRRGPLVTPDGIIRANELCVNTNTHDVTVREKIIILAPIEYKLLYFFITHQDRLYSREQLLNQIWGGEIDVTDRTVDVQIRRLRSRLKPYGYHDYIKTVRGAGYQFVCQKK